MIRQTSCENAQRVKYFHIFTRVYVRGVRKYKGSLALIPCAFSMQVLAYSFSMVDRWKPQRMIKSLNMNIFEDF